MPNKLVHVAFWCVGVFVISVVVPVPVSANPWSSIGPWGGNITALAIDPLTPSTLYAGTNNDLFKSTDAGGTWVVSLTGAYVYGLGIDPQAPSRLYVGTDVSEGQVSRSTDGGMSWTAIAPYRQASSIVVDPVTPTRIYISGVDAAAKTAGIFKSTDGGDTWMLKGGRTGVIAIDPQNPLRLYVAGYDGLYASTDGGEDWRTIWTLSTHSVLIDPINPSTIYTDYLKSTDGGANWTTITLPYPYQHGRLLALDPVTPSTLYAAPDQPEGGVLKSTDAGATWANTGLGSMVSALVIDRAAPATLYAGALLLDGARDIGGILKSTDGGGSWTAANTGLTALLIDTIALDPADPSTIYVGSGSGGILRTSDGGAHWTASNAGLPEHTAVKQLALDSLQPATLYAACARGYFWPGGGLFKSVDGAATWSATGFTSDASTVVVDPLQPSTVYVNGDSESTDGGATWAKTSVYPTPAPRLTAVDPSDDSILYFSRIPLGCTCCNGSGVLKSTDGGSSWVDLGAGLPIHSVSALALEGSGPLASLYAGLWDSSVFVRRAGCAADSECGASTCSTASCDQDSGVCIRTVMPDGTTCGDAVGCMTGTCSSGVCVKTAVPDGTTCSDGVACMTGGTCSSGVCVGQTLDLSTCPLIPGGRGRTHDCMQEWYVPAVASIVSRSGSEISCTDDDPACDAGASASDNACTFRVALCFNNVNQLDPYMSSCTSTDVQQVKIGGSRSTRDAANESNRTALATAMVGLGGAALGGCTNAGAPRDACQVHSDCDSMPGAGDGHCQLRTVEFYPRLSTLNTCTEPAKIRVPLRQTRSGSTRKGVKRLVIKTLSSDSKVYDVDALKLTCLPH